MQKAPGTRDEDYVLDLCDAVLGRKAARQHRFPFLLGDGDRPRQLPVDAFYPELNLVIEYHEQQHSEPVAFFDKPDRRTVSGVPRGQQRAIYERRRREVLPQHGIRVIELSYSDFACGADKRLQRNEQHDIAVVRRKLTEHGICNSEPSDSTRPPQLQKTTARRNNTGLPDQLNAGIESLSGMSMDHVRVHYNSAQPAQLNAHAYAQGSDIHLAPGQEQQDVGGMKGKNVFSRREADRIRELLRQVRKAAPDEQKKLRDRLRNEVGFYIAEFTRSNAGFTADDFDRLVDRGTIKII